MSYWKSKLTPYDTELCMMVESLTGKPCEPKNGGEDHYFIVVDYSKNIDPQFVSAVMDAVLGRIGERLIDMQDNADAQQFVVKIKFSTDKYPGIIRAASYTKPDWSVGDDYAPRDEIVRAVQVLQDDADRVIAFVGNGEFEVPEKGEATFHFVHPVSGLWAYAEQTDFIVNEGNGRVVVMDAEAFHEKYVLR